MNESIQNRIAQLLAGGVVDMHFDLPMELYEKRHRKDVLETGFLPDLETGNISVVGVAIYVEDQYLPEAGLRVALDQIARLYAETGASDRFAICKSFREIQATRETGKIAFLITMEGVEPFSCAFFTNLVCGQLGSRTREPMRRVTVEFSLRWAHHRKV